MKTLKFIIFSLIILASCNNTNENDPNCGQWILGYSNDNNWSRQAIIGDSIQMISNKEAYIYVKGVKTHIFAEQLYPMFIPCK